MIQDPLTVWNGTYPYDALAAAGITPESSHADVEQASFTLMTQRMMNPTAQKAWHELRDVQRRLVADFLLYDVDPAVDIGRARAGTGAPLEASLTRTVPTEILRRLSESKPEPPPPPVVPDDLCAFPTQSFVDSLIRFDR